ncbi:hypothetical protein O6H91_Y365100 [Diphasiastrum complanatum]|nr:hypothetical protein O6H91_Y365100 [Diphasiastrum complanatum]
MWGQQAPYEADSEHSHADQYLLDVQACITNAAAASSNFRSLLLSGSCNITESIWQHAAALVQSPLSEGSTTSIHSECSRSPKNEIIYLKSNSHATISSAHEIIAPSRNDGLLSLQKLLAKDLQEPVSARLLSTESFLVKAKEIQSWTAPEKGSQAEGSNYNLYSMCESGANSQNRRQIHDHSGGSPDRPLDLEGGNASESHKSLSCGSFSSRESYCSTSDTWLGQMKTQPSRIKQEEDVDDFERSILGVRDDHTSLLPTLSLSELFPHSEAPIQSVNPSRRLPDLLSQTLSSCSTSQSISLGSPTSRSEHCTQSPAQISSNFLGSHGGAAFNRNLGLTNNQVGDSFKNNTRCSSFLGDPEQVLEPLFKKPRMDLAPSIPFKKEKLGEKISALQQLVSPFGKTDTASVLLEAIGYIKFLHEQVQVLSMPYMKSTTSQNHEYGTIYWASEEAKDGEEPQQDLQSRGLCLVPVTCTSQLTSENGADYWAPTIAASSR